LARSIYPTLSALMRRMPEMRRAMAGITNNARQLRERQGIVENELLSVQATSWPEAAVKARYIHNLYAP